jgi:hypothetical protein
MAERWEQTAVGLSWVDIVIRGVFLLVIAVMMLLELSMCWLQG